MRLPDWLGALSSSLGGQSARPYAASRICVDDDELAPTVHSQAFPPNMPHKWLPPTQRFSGAVDISRACDAELRNTGLARVRIFRTSRHQSVIACGRCSDEGRGCWPSARMCVVRTGMVAPWVLGGPMNGDVVTTYVTRVLVSELSDGDVVIMDNLSSHNAPAVRAAIEAVGARLLFLPPYSPVFYPIEQAFSKLKAHLQNAAVMAA